VFKLVVLAVVSFCKPFKQAIANQQEQTAELSSK